MNTRKRPLYCLERVLNSDCCDLEAPDAHSVAGMSSSSPQRGSDAHASERLMIDEGPACHPVSGHGRGYR